MGKSTISMVIFNSFLYVYQNSILLFQMWYDEVSRCVRPTWFLGNLAQVEAELKPQDVHARNRKWLNTLGKWCFNYQTWAFFKDLIGFIADL